MIVLSLLVCQYLFCTPALQPIAPAFPYLIHSPDQTFVMPEDLKEISGISLADGGDFLLAVQDEKGILYYLNKNTGVIERQVKFWENGDYEDVASVGKTVYVVKSSGTIYEIPENAKEVKKYNFSLDAENDVEGLTFDAANNRLLLACKAKIGVEDSKGKRGVYAFDLQNKNISKEPVLTIEAKEVRAYLKSLPNTDTNEKLMDAFKSEQLDFAPSAIAINPKSGNICLLSAVGNVLLVLDSMGNVVHVEKLKKKVHAQPEGICFDLNGTMYISNEAKDGEPGKVYVFKMKM